MRVLWASLTSRVIARYYAKKTDLLESVAAHVRGLLKMEPDTELDVWEEVTMKNVGSHKFTDTVEIAKLRSGDILVFQRSLTEEEQEKFRYPTAPHYFDFLAKRVTVSFRPKNGGSDDDKEVCV